MLKLFAMRICERSRAQRHQVISGIGAAFERVCRETQAVKFAVTTNMGDALRRVVTTPYAEQFGLSVSEWRVLSLLAHAKQLPFGELVTQSTSDKSLVSRTLRLLEGRGLVEICPEGENSLKRLLCRISTAGDALHAQVIPLARRAQAEMIRTLTPVEREGLYAALKTLRRHCLPDRAQLAGREG